MTRHAVYWAPERAHALWTAGCDWLGRDPEQDIALGPVRAGTAEPRRYGLHATLKAPMRLGHDIREDALFDALERLAAGTRRFTLPALEVALMDGFVALRPAAPVAVGHPLRRLADACVSELDALRATPNQAETQLRLRSQALDAQGMALLQRWGYPHVFERWRFHMTLSDALPDNPAGHAAQARLLAEAKEHFARALAEPLVCASVSVFTEPSPGAPFVLARRFAFAAA